jgi:hypothetical protein
MYFFTLLILSGGRGNPRRCSITRQNRRPRRRRVVVEDQGVRRGCRVPVPADVPAPARVNVPGDARVAGADRRRFAANLACPGLRQRAGPVVATFRPVMALVTGQLHRPGGVAAMVSTGRLYGFESLAGQRLEPRPRMATQEPGRRPFRIAWECRFRWRGQCDRWYERPRWVRNAGKRDHPAGLNRRRALPAGERGDAGER